MHGVPVCLSLLDAGQGRVRSGDHTHTHHNLKNGTRTERYGTKRGKARRGEAKDLFYVKKKGPDA